MQATIQHADMIRSGVAVWNEHRMRNPGLRPDLRGQDFSDLDLEGIDLRFCRVDGANFSRCNLSYALLYGSNWDDVLSMADCRVWGARF